MNVEFTVTKLMEKYDKEEVPCALCGSTEFKPLRDKDRYGLDVNIVSCERCNLIQINPRLPQGFYDQFYGRYYRDLHKIDERIGDLDAYFDWQYKRAVEVFGEVKVGKDALLLEVGCSAGGILQYFKDCGFRVRGIDLDERYVKYAQSKGLDVTLDTLETVDIDERPGNVIMSHVLEHLLDPVDSLRRIKELMHPRGHLFIEVPGVNNLLKYDMDFDKCTQLAHVYYFSQETLNRMLRWAGFDVTQINDEVRSLSNPTMLVDGKFLYQGKSASIVSDPVDQSTPRMIAGCPRSGTMFMAKVMQKIGFDMPHQELGKDGVVSWMHICNNEYRVECDTVIHQVRDPLKVIGSTAYSLHKSAYPFMVDCVGQVKSNGFAHHLLAAMWFWYKWNLLIEARAKYRFRVEDIDEVLPELLDELGLWVDDMDIALDDIKNMPKNINKVANYPEVTWKELRAVDSKMAGKVKRLAVKYGY